MYINSSHISMASSRSYSKVTYTRRQEAIMSSSDAAVFTLSDEGKSAVEQLESYKEELAKEEEKRNKENQQEVYSQMLVGGPNEIKEPEMSLTSLEELKMQLIEKLLTSFMRRRGRDLTSLKEELSKASSKEFSMSSRQLSIGKVLKADLSNTTVWKRITAVSGFQDEVEQTAYQANGLVTTKDGRKIEFGVTVEMSRSFCQKYESLAVEDYVFTDPLVVNLDTSVAKVTDQKFLFDLNSDGEMEEMSFVTGGSGFLALDKNGDGLINDGSELFGTKSGDGFKDLSQYDKDGNGWIDEADNIFKDLVIWTKDENGEDHLMSLSKADIGAIYLGSASTEFSLNQMETNNTNAVIRSTGVFLRDSNGTVGTIQHVDFAV